MFWFDLCNVSSFTHFYFRKVRGSFPQKVGIEQRKYLVHGAWSDSDTGSQTTAKMLLLFLIVVACETSPLPEKAECKAASHGILASSLT